MADTVGKAYVQIVPSAQGIKAGIGNALQPGAKTAGIGAGNAITSGIKGMIAKAAIGTAVVAGIKKSVSEGAALEQSLGGIETLFKKNADTVVKNAQKAYKTAGMSANEYMENVTSFSAGLIKSVGGDTAKAAKTADMAMIDMSDNANKMGTNIEDIKHAYQGFAKQNYTMLDNLKLGYGGTKQEMQRLLSDAEKLTGQKYDMNNLDDVYNAIHAIQKDIGITGTTSKEASKTVSGSLNAMKAAATDFMGQLAIGGDIKTPLKALVTTAGTFLFDNLFPMIGNILSAIPGAVMTGIQVIGPQLMPAAQNLMKYLFEGIQQAWDAAPGLLDNLITVLQNELPKIANNMKTALGNLMSNITENMPAIMERIGSMLKTAGLALIDALPGMISGLADLMAMIADFVIANLPVIVKAGAELVVALASGLIRNLPAILAAVAKLLGTAFRNMIKLAATAWKCGLAIIKAVAKGLGGAALSLIKAAAKKIVNSIVKTITGVIKSVKKIVKSIGDAFKKLPDSVKGVVTKVKNLLSFSGLVSKVKGIWNSVKNAIESPIDTAKNAVSRAISTIKGFFPLNIGNIFSNLKLPKFSVSGGKAPFGLGGKGSLPKFNVSWAAKGGLVDGATLIGAGERGKEAILPLKPFWARLDKIGAQNSKTINYNIGDITLDASSLDDVATIEDFVDILRKAKAFA